MAQIKETRITGMMIEVGISDANRADFIITLNAITRDNANNPVTLYRQDITAEASDEATVQVLIPLIRRAMGRIMTDRNITPEDLAEGDAAQTPTNLPMTAQMENPDAAEEDAPDAPQRPEDGPASARAQAEEHERAHAEEVEARIRAGEEYALQVESAQRETAKRESAQRRKQATRPQQG